MSDILTFKINLEHDGLAPEKKEEEKEKPMKKTDLFIIGKKEKSHNATVGCTWRSGRNRRSM